MVLVLFCLASAVPLGAQDGSLREGYVIVTPTFGDQSRLTAFETFRFRDSSGSSQASVLDSTLSTNASVFVNTDTDSRRYSGVALVNPSRTIAQVTLALYRASGGSPIDSVRLSIPAGKQETYMVNEIFPGIAQLPDGFNGLLNVTSTSSPVGIVGLRFQNADFSTVPLVRNLPLEPIVPPQPNGAGGPGAVLFPQFAAGGGWSTEIVLTNTGFGQVSVRVDVFDNNGVPMANPFDGSASLVTIPTNGVAVLSAR